MNKLTTQQIQTLLQQGKLFRLHKDDTVQFFIKNIGGAWHMMCRDENMTLIENMGSVAMYPVGITVIKRPTKGKFNQLGRIEYADIIFTKEDIAEALNPPAHSEHSQHIGTL